MLVRHGEVILKSVDTLPSNISLVEEKKKIIVAHSETGHHHILETKTKNIKLYKTALGEMYLEVPESAELWHQKTGTDVHKTHTIKPSIYKIIIKKEFDYFKGVIKNVRD